MQEKTFIPNRKGKRLAVLIDKMPSQKGLAFIMHGLGGNKDQPQIKAFAEAFNSKGYSTVRFDTADTLGESDGNYEDATVSSYLADLEDVIDWAGKQDWYREPFFLIGHSLGGICTALFVEKHPEKVKALAPLSTVVSGKLSLEAHPEWPEWKKTGWIIQESKSKPGLIKKLKWSHYEDRLEYDLLKGVSKLTMPVLMVVGENDTSTPISHQKLLFDRLQGRKELHTIKGAEHTFRDEKHLEEIKNIIDRWLTYLDHVPC
jgi:pimeloyl-ACP methyl ester carboxylesterase